MDVELLLRSKIKEIPDYPKKGVIFRDMTPLLKDRRAFRLCVDELAGRLKDEKVDYIVGIESRGFILGSALAYAMGKGFIPIRKKGKLPRKKVSIEYQLEYGTDTIEVHEDAAERGSSVLIVDDLLATGGTAKAASELVEKLGARVAGFAFLIELSELGGIERLGGRKVLCLLKY